MQSFVSDDFIEQIRDAPVWIRNEARRAYRLFREDPYNAQLHFKPLRHKKSSLWSVRVFNTGWRALGLMRDGDMYWDFFGDHGDYDKEIKKYS